MRAGWTHSHHGGTDLPSFSLGNERDQEGGQKTNRDCDPKFYKGHRTRRTLVGWKADVLKYGDNEEYERKVDGVKRVGKPRRPTEETRRKAKFNHWTASDHNRESGRNDRIDLPLACGPEVPNDHPGDDQASAQESRREPDEPGPQSLV